jgi:hypothetical protein
MSILKMPTEYIWWAWTSSIILVLMTGQPNPHAIISKLVANASGSNEFLLMSLQDKEKYSENLSNYLYNLVIWNRQPLWQIILPKISLAHRMIRIF